jgi:anti-sigma B factor antagonist
VKGEELEDGIRIFIVRGELDMGTAPDLERELRPVFADPDASVMLDLSECEFIDSTGIALVVRLWQHLGQGTGHLVLCSPKLQVRRLLQITGVESSIPMHEQRDAALAALRG